MSEARMQPRDVFDLVSAGAIWGASFMFQRVAAPHFGAFALAFLRVAIAALLLMAWQVARGGGREPLTRWRTLAVVGIVNTAVPFLCFAYATMHISAGLAAVLNGTAALFSAVIGFLVFAERLDPRRITGLLGGFAGVIVLVWHDLQRADHVLPVIACLGAAVCYSIGAHIIKRRLAGVNASTVAAGSQVYAALSLALPAALAWPAVNPPASAWASAVTVGAVFTGLAYMLFFRLIQSIGETRAIIVAYLIPLFGMFWGSVLLKEPLTLNMIVGCAMIIGGVAMSTRGPAPSQRLVQRIS
jgi:drug/metabolite transporter (DMT)-like permease